MFPKVIPPLSFRIIVSRNEATQVFRRQTLERGALGGVVYENVAFVWVHFTKF